VRLLYLLPQTTKIMKRAELKQIINKVLNEMALPEMARTAGTGGSYTITPEGEEILRQAKASGAAPTGFTASKIAILVWLFKAKQEGKRVQKIDYAVERGVQQSAVNPLFNSLETDGFISKEGYTSIPKAAPTSTRPKPDVSSLLGDLDI
jgi:hypothetical protein